MYYVCVCYFLLLALVEEVAWIHGERDQLARDHAQMEKSSRMMAHELKTKNQELTSKYHRLIECC